MQWAAKIISFIFHPVFMPVLGIYLLFSGETEVAFQTDERNQQLIYILMLVLVVAPLVSTLILYRFKMLDDLEMRDSQQRLAPFATTLMFYVMAYYVMNRGQALIHPLVFSAISGAIVSLGLTILITLKWKISIHMVGIAGVTGLTYALSYVLFYSEPLVLAGLILACGIVGSARMIRKAHTLWQIYAGAILGFTVEFIFIRYQIVL